jgi:hypothetical protein
MAPLIEQVAERGVSDEVADDALNRSAEFTRDALRAFGRFDGLPEDVRPLARDMSAMTLVVMGALLIDVAREISPETVERMEEDDA